MSLDNPQGLVRWNGLSMAISELACMGYPGTLPQIRDPAINGLWNLSRTMGAPSCIWGGFLLVKAGDPCPDLVC